MAEYAMRETLAYALDVDGFREHFGFTTEDVSDERLLTRLHLVRARSTHMPESAREESAKWPQQHGKAEYADG
jgi:hypothetical protein